MISITVLRHPEYSQDTLTIPGSGQINLPDAGAISIAGQTPTQAARTIAHALSGQLVSPEVTVILRTARPRRVFVLGAVAKSGVYEIGRGWRISDAITAVAGLQGRADETAATLSRPPRTSIPIDVQEVMRDPSSPRNLLLREGDTLSFRALDPSLVTISGDVQRPGVVPLRTAPRLLDALTLVGDTKEPTSRTEAVLYRQGHKIPLDLQGAEATNSDATNIPLQKGDFILVNTIPLLQVTVSGPTVFVRNPGSLSLPPGSGVAQAIAQAGLSVLPEQVVTTIIRGRQNIPVNLERAAIDPEFNLLLQSGDTVSINEPKVIRVTVAGAVKNPGALRIAPGSTVFEALAKAGGLSVRPDEAHIALLRAPLPNAEPSNAERGSRNAENEASLLPISDFPVPRSVNDPAQNLPLRDGDLISVTQIKLPTVIVSGQVVKTGPYQVAEGEGIRALLARAGGTTPDALLSRVVLERGGQTQTLDISKEVRLGEKPVVTLRDGDSVIVPENRARVVVTNAVLRPGSYTIPEDRPLTVTGALALAGGPRDQASVKNVVLLRPNPRAEKGVERRIISLGDIARGDLSQDVTLQSGDYVYVPEARASSTGSLLSSLGQVVGTLTGLRYLTGR